MIIKLELITTRDLFNLIEFIESKETRQPYLDYDHECYRIMVKHIKPVVKIIKQTQAVQEVDIYGYKFRFWTVVLDVQDTFSAFPANSGYQIKPGDSSEVGGHQFELVQIPGFESFPDLSFEVLRDANGEPIIKD
ncbi:hypothetical protein COT97_03650 [Candidatus Falkowbacteria bacterium CG10_big_fil_rev_8_21_14_0_10_39_11]|uniref:Uncharacterized protein n=1 Tax=Candidatus Falkowbacteria bacterium CG10_big_fil_rev_8_21_14_0_10_39_11 TaxID=1974565 RepID=A0A2H0V4M7_9BACT|nr:MAG: hypothetical protein COT97_03650 [Candidatus Falkowbacteria bacterium CG10_big_fil_rev_8_21_14_0_10_39_11]